MFKHLTLAGIASVMLLTSFAAPASAREYWTDHYGHRHYYQHAAYYDHRGNYHSRHHVRSCRAAGTGVGVIGGAVLGNAITHHSAVGTIVGAGIGGVAGHSIARNNCR
ncbi:MAG: hypothetical protein ABUL73_04840 [Alphaproteobacteria bacterium]